MVSQLILLSVLLVLSAFFSGSETALFALTPYELAQFRRDKRASRRLVAELMRRARPLLLTLMVGNVTVNMFIFATSLSVFQAIPGKYAVLAPVFGLVSPVLVVLFGDILPKGLAIVLRVRIAPRAAPLTRAFQIALSPVTYLLNTVLVGPLTRLLAGGPRHQQPIAPEELRELVELCERRRVIDADENAMLSGVIQLHELRVRNIMVPRVDIVAFEIHDDPDELKRILREQRFPKLPIYDQTIDHIVGLVYAKDLFLNPAEPLEKLVRPVRFVPELITVTDLLSHFRRTRTQLAIVVDEYGGVVGLVTLEDVAEEIVGELSLSEEEERQPLWEQLDSRRYRLSGRLSVRDWADLFEVRLLDERVTTLAGLVMARLGRVPKVGDTIRVTNLSLSVASLRGHRVEWLTLELLDDAEAELSYGGKAYD